MNANQETSEDILGRLLADAETSPFSLPFETGVAGSLHLTLSDANLSDANIRYSFLSGHARLTC